VPTAPQFAVIFTTLVAPACRPHLAWRATFVLFLLVFLRGFSEIVYLARPSCSRWVLGIARLAVPTRPLASGCS
jgi:hypothetical protein